MDAINEHAHYIAERLKQSLERHNRVPVKFLEQDIREDEEHWWVVPVWPAISIAERYPYYETLADVEMELEEEGIHITLVPTEPPS